MAVRTHVVTVIGGGASGALAAHQLLRQAPAPVRVIVVEPRAELGRGVAYGTKDPRHPACRVVTLPFWHRVH